MIKPIFEISGQIITPCLSRNRDGSINQVDGERFCDLEQTAERTGETPAALHNLYKLFLSRLMPPRPADADMERILKDHVYPDLSPEQFAHLMEVHRRLDLDPWLNLLWIESKHDPKSGRPKHQVMTTIDGLRTLAEGTGIYRGQTAPRYLDEQGHWLNAWPHARPPVAVKIGIWRKGRKKPSWGVAYWDDYAKRDETGQLDPLYEQKPRMMLTTCAESVAIRRALGRRLARIYTNIELANSIDPLRRKNGPASATAKAVPSADPPPDWDARYLSSTGVRLALLEEFSVTDPAQRDLIVSHFIKRWPTLHAHNPEKFFADLLNAIWANPMAHGITAAQPA